MNIDLDVIASCLPFEKRYELKRLRWLDGPHQSFEAFDRVLEREVVVNMPWAYTSIPRFVKTAKVAASLSHPNLLPVLDLGIANEGRPFFTTPPVRELPLDTIVGRLELAEDRQARAGRAFPLVPIVGAVSEVCRVIEYAHERGFLHLDLYPGAILIGADYHAVLDTTGCDNLRAQDEWEADPIGILGRPSFMSPEQAKGVRPRPPTDVFGLGATLHFILFGTPPNHLPGASKIGDVLKAIDERAFEPRRRGRLRPEIRGRRDRKMAHRLAAVCLKALAYEPDQRYPTAAALGDALDESLERCRGSWWQTIR